VGFALTNHDLRHLSRSLSRWLGKTQCQPSVKKIVSNFISPKKSKKEYLDDK
jgi:hypothetical protein